MAPNLPKGIKTAFGNTPQAKNDLFNLSEGIEDGVAYLDVTSNDLGGNAKSLYSLDDGANQDGSPNGSPSSDLLQQDAVNVVNFSRGGARIWIAPDGKVAYDASTLSIDLNSLGEGQVYTDVFTYAIRMSNGAISWATATVEIVGTNDGPVITSGPQSGNVKEDDSLYAAGQVTATDADIGDQLQFSGNANGTYGTFAIDADTGEWTYTLNNGAANVQALAQGESHDEVFAVTVTDGYGATTTQDVTVHVAGTNDTPEIINGPQSGAVTEDSAVTQATGHLNAIDPDNNATQSWSVVGGTASGSVDYEFRADSFKITRFGTDLLRDGFGNDIPPPSSPPFNPDTIQNPTTYFTNGGFTESGGRLYFDSDNAVSFVSVGTPDPTVGQVALARTNIDPSIPNLGLRQNAPFTIEAIFDLTLPDSPREAYGIRATDRLIGGPGNPPDDLGDDTYDLVVRENIFGQDVVQLRHIDFVNDTTTGLGSFVIAAPIGADQIRLVFDHTQNSTGLQAYFQYWSSATNSQVGATQTFAAVAPVFAADSIDTQTWIRGGVIAYAPLFTDSNLDGTYGTLNVNQAGNWTYTLNNGLASTQSLAQGQTVTDTFDVKVVDEFGATDTTTVTVDITGSNDAPTMQTTAVSRILTEDEASPDLTATGLAQFSDVDLTDNHTISAVLQAASRSSGGPISPGLSAILGGAMTASEVNPSTGDGHGEIQWDFALANNETQFLAGDEFLTLIYDVNVTDPFGATASQAVTVTINGAWETPTYIADGLLDASALKSGTNDIIVGSGIPADHFGIVRAEDAGIELGLAVHHRSIVPNPAYVTTDDYSDGVLNFVVHEGQAVAGGAPKAEWSFDFSIATGLNGQTTSLDDFKFQLLYDVDPGAGTSYRTLILEAETSSQPLGDSGFQWRDEDTNLVFIFDDKGNANVTQNSENYGFGFFQSFLTDPYGAGNGFAGPAEFDIILEAYDSSNTLIAQNHINVDVLL